MRALLLVLLSACASAPPPLPAPVRTEIVRTAETMTGQKLALPDGPAELTASATELPPGARLPVHKHPWQRIVYVERGRLEVINHDTGLRREFEAGDVLVEAVGQWHEGRVLGGEGARLIVYDLAPPGADNMVVRKDD